MKVVTAVITALIMAGCASLEWTHPTKLTNEEFNHDSYDCRQTAWQYTRNMGYSANPLIAAGEFNECMWMKYGWKRQAANPRPKMVEATKNATTTQAQPQQSASNRTQTFDDGKAAYNKGDYAQAIKIWGALATLGNADAQNNLGVMYVMGIGVTRDDQEALKWFRLAAAQGMEPAKEALKRPEMVGAAKLGQ